MEFKELLEAITKVKREEQTYIHVIGVQCPTGFQMTMAEKFRQGLQIYDILVLPLFGYERDSYIRDLLKEHAKHFPYPFVVLYENPHALDYSLFDLNLHLYGEDNGNRKKSHE